MRPAWESCGRLVPKERADFFEFVLCNVIFAALALAGVGPERTRVEIWADPGVSRNTHTIRVEAAAARLTMTIENVPSEANPRTGLITPLSILACLRGLTSTLKVGS